MTALNDQKEQAEKLDQIISAYAKQRAAGRWAKQEKRILVMTYDPRQPYDDLHFLPPVQETELKPVLKQCQAASTYLQELERVGILVGEKNGREVIYKHPALLEVLST